MKIMMKMKKTIRMRMMIKTMRMREMTIKMKTTMTMMEKMMTILFNDIVYNSYGMQK